MVIKEVNELRTWAEKQEVEWCFSLSTYSQRNAIRISQLNFLNLIINLLNNMHDNQFQVRFARLIYMLF